MRSKLAAFRRFAAMVDFAALYPPYTAYAPMKIYSQDGSELMDVASLERDGDALVIKGKVFGAMPMSARLTPGEARKGFGLLNAKLFFFLLTFLFRKG